MTKKDFEATAAIIVGMHDLPYWGSSESRNLGVRKVAEEFADHFETQNPRFDRERFLFACGVVR